MSESEVDLLVAQETTVFWPPFLLRIRIQFGVERGRKEFLHNNSELRHTFTFSIKPSSNIEHSRLMDSSRSASTSPSPSASRPVRCHCHIRLDRRCWARGRSRRRDRDRDRRRHRHGQRPIVHRVNVVFSASNSHRVRAPLQVIPLQASL